jgi:hypothetical protein
MREGSCLPSWVAPSPQASVNSLYQIGVAARQTEQTDLTLHVLSSLHNIETSSSDAAAKDRAREYATKLEAAKINPQM